METLRNKALAASVLVTTALFALASAAGAQTTDPVEGQITSVRDQFSGYALVLVAAVGVIVAAYIGIPLVKKFARMVRNAIG